LPFFSESSPFTTTPSPTPLGDVTDAISSDKDTYFRYYDENHTLLVSILQHGGSCYLLIICKWPRSTFQKEDVLTILSTPTASYRLHKMSYSMVEIQIQIQIYTQHKEAFSLNQML
jgi:hypothetical protein